MPGVAHLTEEDEQAERDSRDRLRRADHRLHELRDRRSVLLADIRRLSDEQRSLYDSRAPKEEKVEEFHREYQAIGHELADLRARRESLRPRLAELVQSLRQAPRERREGGRGRPDQLRREMAELELRQQTVALPIAEENAMIDRIRALGKEIGVADLEAQGLAAERLKREGVEEELRRTRAEFERLGEEFSRLRQARNDRFESVKSQLVSVGQVVGEIREKARKRGELFQHMEELNRQIAEADREIREALQGSRDRRREARQTIVSYNRGVRESVGGQDALAHAAEENLEVLLRNGKVRLGG
ncbi:MAG: hypothetical protein L3K07_05475 [Thermoplasmata archaeon]|nr:hypothetical protein [Thermoplasmata archaeon]